MIERYKSAQSTPLLNPQGTQGRPALLTTTTSSQLCKMPASTRAASPVEEDELQTILGDTAGMKAENADDEIDGNAGTESNI